MVDRHKKADPDAVIAEFETRRDGLERLCERTKDLIEACLQDAQIPYQSVQARVKSKEKLREKYTDPRKDYHRLDDITDLAGLRIITYYEDDVDKAAEVINREFEVDAANSVDKRETEPDRFGYYALNFVCSHTQRRTDDVEYKKFSGARFEVQITSILRHAWSEIQHDWYDMKAACPDPIKRRFARMAALIEIAESEFLDLRKMRSDLQRSMAVQVQANVPDLPLDQASLKAFIQQDPAVAKLDEAIAKFAGRPPSAEIVRPFFLSEAVRASESLGLKTLSRLRSEMDAHPGAVVDCARVLLGKTEDVPRGFCIFALTLMLLAQRGEDSLPEFIAAADPRPSETTVSRTKRLGIVFRRALARHERS